MFLYLDKYIFVQIPVTNLRLNFFKYTFLCHLIVYRPIHRLHFRCIMDTGLNTYNNININVSLLFLCPLYQVAVQ